MLSLSEVERTRVLVVLRAAKLTKLGNQGNVIAVHSPTFMDQQTIISNQANGATLKQAGLHGSEATLEKLLHVLPALILAGLRPLNCKVRLRILRHTINGSNQGSSTTSSGFPKDDEVVTHALGDLY